tara:strand:- start:953 stop:1141 length:189 start_codon:yes stop_codon:yes gene_type:complete
MVKNYIDGLYVKDGRLINDRPDSRSGLERATEIRRAVERQNNIDQISEGIRRAQELAKYMDY